MKAAAGTTHSAGHIASTDTNLAATAVGASAGAVAAALASKDLPRAAGASGSLVTAGRAGGALSAVRSIMEDSTASKASSVVRVRAASPVKQAVSTALRGVSTPQPRKRHPRHAGTAPASAPPKPLRALSRVKREGKAVNTMAKHANKVAAALPLSSTSPRAGHTQLVAAAATTKALGPQAGLWLVGKEGLASLEAQAAARAAAGQELPAEVGGEALGNVVGHMRSAATEASQLARTRVLSGATGSRMPAAFDAVTGDAGEASPDRQTHLSAMERATFAKSLSRAYADRQLGHIQGIIARADTRQATPVPVMSPSSSASPTLTAGSLADIRNTTPVLTPGMQRILYELNMGGSSTQPRRGTVARQRTQNEEEHNTIAGEGPAFDDVAGLDAATPRSSVSGRGAPDWDTHGGLLSPDPLVIARSLDRTLREARGPGDLTKDLPTGVASSLVSLLGPILASRRRNAGADAMPQGESLPVAPLASSGTEASDHRRRSC